MYEPEVGDEITFAKAEINRNTVYTVTEINDAEITITTPKGYLYQGSEVFIYYLTPEMFESLAPRTLQAAKARNG